MRSGVSVVHGLKNHLLVHNPRRGWRSNRGYLFFFFFEDLLNATPCGRHFSIYYLLSSLWPHFTDRKNQGSKVLWDRTGEHPHHTIFIIKQTLFYAYRFVLVCFVFDCSYPQQVGVKTLARDVLEIMPWVDAGQAGAQKPEVSRVLWDVRKGIDNLSSSFSLKWM